MQPQNGRLFETPVGTKPPAHAGRPPGSYLPSGPTMSNAPPLDPSPGMALAEKFGERRLKLRRDQRH